MPTSLSLKLYQLQVKVSYNLTVSYISQYTFLIMDLRDRTIMNYSEYDERDEVVLREVEVDEDGRPLPALEQAGIFFFSNFFPHVQYFSLHVIFVFSRNSRIFNILLSFRYDHSSSW